jgi:hypothetical protein
LAKLVIFVFLSFRSRIKSGMTDPESIAFSTYYATGCRIKPVLNLIGDPAWQAQIRRFFELWHSLGCKDSCRYDLLHDQFWGITLTLQKLFIVRWSMSTDECCRSKMVSRPRRPPRSRQGKFVRHDARQIENEYDDDIPAGCVFPEHY